ncbi:MAG TPA: hypothetical protein ENN55_03255 [Firmicutes bacterium]|nr:hypothetical protein [Bacillota bacterium]
MRENKRTIETDRGKLKVSSFISFGDDPEYFAVCGRDLYRKTGGKEYSLMEKNFKNRICETD